MKRLQRAWGFVGVTQTSNPLRIELLDDNNKPPASASDTSVCLIRRGGRRVSLRSETQQTVSLQFGGRFHVPVNRDVAHNSRWPVAVTHFERAQGKLTDGRIQFMYRVGRSV